MLVAFLASSCSFLRCNIGESLIFGKKLNHEWLTRNQSPDFPMRAGTMRSAAGFAIGHLLAAPRCARPNSVMHFYLANSPLADHIVFVRNGSTVMTTSNKYDYLNRTENSWGDVNGWWKEI